MSKSSFYVSLKTMAEEENEMVCLKKKDTSSIPKPNLLPGEIMVCEIPNVLRFDAMGEKKKGISGVLCATNFRVAFLTAGLSANKRQSVFVSNSDLTDNGELPNTQSQDEVLIPQSCIMYICSVNGEKVKRIQPNHVFKSKLEHLVIYCKDFRIISFGFKFCSKENQRKIVNSILQYAYPTSISRLFAFDYSPALGKQRDSVPGEALLMFRSPEDWTSELRRLNSAEFWRVTEANKDFLISDSLGQYLVCPNQLKDDNLVAAAIHYTNGRLPFWCWNHPKTGVPLLCSISLPESDLLEKHESQIFDKIKLTYPKGKQTPITTFNVSTCASIRDLELSFEKVKELCMHENEKDFWAGDNHWLTNIDGTRWLSHIATSLQAANGVAKLIHVDAIPVVVRGVSGRDLSLVISSLVQLMMDPYYRTLRGFQCLIQKMWVIFGHPFAKRAVHIKVTKKEDKDEVTESPVFLHFLDCVHQLLHQFPSAFEFSETFLLGLLDCVYSCMFETFLFDSERDRANTIKQENSPKQLVSLWEYITENLASAEFSLFLNPLYEFQQVRLSQEHESKLDDSDYLEANIASQCIQFWASCYLRWLPIAKQTVGRGHGPSMHLQQILLMSELRYLRQRLAVLETDEKGGPEENRYSGYSLSSQEAPTPLFTPGIGDFKSSILNSLTGPFSFSEFSLNPVMNGKSSIGTSSDEEGTQV